MWREESNEKPVATSRLIEAPVDPRLPFAGKKYNNGFVVYQKKTGSKVESDQLCKLRDMASRARRRHLVTRAITYVVATLAVITLLLLEFTMKTL